MGYMMELSRILELAGMPAQAEKALLAEAKKKKLRPQPTFKKYTSFDKWNDENGGEYEEIEIDGKLIGVLYIGNDMIGMWYNKAKIGSISNDYAKLYPEYKDDGGVYAELDPNWPYGN